MWLEGRGVGLFAEDFNVCERNFTRDVIIRRCGHITLTQTHSCLLSINAA